ncbi:hypothetical protein PLESTB_000059800 [Pleodorina starrii]|uniref:Myb-like domain-containing protein n=1 Tax=Pleodorina starrii TaxID=330485 RepID=A0A9W6EXK7_9CHLO|nr:hypothetical protein PLESTB_000059800 [Pleodorina starrii]
MAERFVPPNADGHKLAPEYESTAVHALGSLPSTGPKRPYDGAQHDDFQVAGEPLLDGGDSDSHLGRGKRRYTPSRTAAVSGQDAAPSPPSPNAARGMAGSLDGSACPSHNTSGPLQLALPGAASADTGPSLMSSQGPQSFGAAPGFIGCPASAAAVAAPPANGPPLTLLPPLLQPQAAPAPQQQPQPQLSPLLPSNLLGLNAPPAAANPSAPTLAGPPWPGLQQQQPQFAPHLLLVAQSPALQPHALQLGGAAMQKQQLQQQPQEQLQQLQHGQQYHDPDQPDPDDSGQDSDDELASDSEPDQDPQEGYHHHHQQQQPPQQQVPLGGGAAAQTPSQVAPGTPPAQHPTAFTGSTPGAAAGSGGAGMVVPASFGWAEPVRQLYAVLDSMALHEAMGSGRFTTLRVHWVNRPPALAQHGLEVLTVPQDCTVGFLKRAICMASGCALWPQTLRPMGQGSRQATTTAHAPPTSGLHPEDLVASSSAARLSVSPVGSGSGAGAGSGYGGGPPSSTSAYPAATAVTGLTPFGICTHAPVLVQPPAAVAVPTVGRVVATGAAACCMQAAAPTATAAAPTAATATVASGEGLAAAAAPAGISATGDGSRVAADNNSSGVAGLPSGLQAQLLCAFAAAAAAAGGVGVGGQTGGAGGDGSRGGGGDGTVGGCSAAAAAAAAGDGLVLAEAGILPDSHVAMEADLQLPPPHQQLLLALLHSQAQARAAALGTATAASTALPGPSDAPPGTSCAAAAAATATSLPAASAARAGNSAAESAGGDDECGDDDNAGGAGGSRREGGGGGGGGGGCSPGGKPRGAPGGPLKERFTLQEMEALVSGIEEFGLKWALIKKRRPELGNKNHGDLKDKWRNWQRNVAASWATSRVSLPDPLRQRINALVAAAQRGELPTFVTLAAQQLLQQLLQQRTPGGAQQQLPQPLLTQQALQQLQPHLQLSLQDAAGRPAGSTVGTLTTPPAARASALHGAALATNRLEQRYGQPPQQTLQQQASRPGVQSQHQEPQLEGTTAGGGSGQRLGIGMQHEPGGQPLPPQLLLPPPLPPPQPPPQQALLQQHVVLDAQQLQLQAVQAAQAAKAAQEAQAHAQAQLAAAAAAVAAAAAAAGQADGGGVSMRLLAGLQLGAHLHLHGAPAAAALPLPLSLALQSPGGAPGLMLPAPAAAAAATMVGPAPPGPLPGVVPAATLVGSVPTTAVGAGQSHPNQQQHQQHHGMALNLAGAVDNDVTRGSVVAVASPAALAPQLGMGMGMAPLGEGFGAGSGPAAGMHVPQPVLPVMTHGSALLAMAAMDPTAGQQQQAQQQQQAAPVVAASLVPLAAMGPAPLGGLLDPMQQQQQQQQPAVVPVVAAAGAGAHPFLMQPLQPLQPNLQLPQSVPGAALLVAGPQLQLQPQLQPQVPPQL